MSITFADIAITVLQVGTVFDFKITQIIIAILSRSFVILRWCDIFLINTTPEYDQYT